MNYYRAEPEFDGYLFDEPVTINGIERVGSISAYGNPNTGIKRIDMREVAVYFHTAQDEQEHVLSVTAIGSASVDGENFIARNNGIPLPFLPSKIRKRRMVNAAEQGMRGLNIAGLVDFAGARILKAQRSVNNRHLVAANLAAFKRSLA